MQYKTSFPDLNLLRSSITLCRMKVIFFHWYLRNVLLELLLVQQMEGHYKTSDGSLTGSLKFK